MNSVQKEQESTKKCSNGYIQTFECNTRIGMDFVTDSLKCKHRHQTSLSNWRMIDFDFEPNLTCMHFILFSNALIISICSYCCSRYHFVCAFNDSLCPTHFVHSKLCEHCIFFFFIILKKNFQIFFGVSFHPPSDK